MLGLLQEAFLIKINRALNSAILELSHEHGIKFSGKLVRLNNKKILIKILNLPLPIVLNYIIEFRDNKFNISIYDNNLNHSNVDLTISMSVGSLIRAKFTGLDHVIRERDIELSGDLNIAMELQDILNNTDIDTKLILQEKIAESTSDAFAWQFMNLLDKVLFRINLKHQEFAEQVSDFLLTERDILVHRVEVDKFMEDVDSLRDDLARLEAMVERL